MYTHTHTHSAATLLHVCVQSQQGWPLLQLNCVIVALMWYSPARTSDEVDPKLWLLYVCVMGFNVGLRLDGPVGHARKTRMYPHTKRS